MECDPGPRDLVWLPIGNYSASDGKIKVDLESAKTTSAGRILAALKDPGSVRMAHALCAPGSSGTFQILGREGQILADNVRFNGSYVTPLGISSKDTAFTFIGLDNRSVDGMAVAFLVPTDPDGCGTCP